MSTLSRTSLLSLWLAASGVAGELPPLFSPRASPQSREAARQAAGFPDHTHQAIDRALQFLNGQQNRDGSWGEHRKVAMTSLALLAHLGHGITPVDETHGELLTNGLLYLIDISQKGKGKLGTLEHGRYDPLWPLEHALATQALAESHLVCRDLGDSIPGLQDALQVAAQWIIDNQHQDGGWAYRFSEDGPRGSDSWLIVPLLHALWLSHRAGVETRNLKLAVHKTFALIESRQLANGALQFPVSAARPGSPMTGGCAFAFQIANRSAHIVPRKAVAFVAKREPFRYQATSSASDLLALHYEALAMFNHGGKSWDDWHRDRIPELLKHQEADGSFAPQNDQPRRHPKDATIERSSLACLILQTPSRYHLEK